MGTKLDPGEFDCHGAAADDEPIFTLRAKDVLAPPLVRMWAENRRYQIRMGIKPASDEAKCAEAIECAQAMENWKARNA